MIRLINSECAVVFVRGTVKASLTAIRRECGCTDVICTTMLGDEIALVVETCPKCLKPAVDGFGAQLDMELYESSTVNPDLEKYRQR